MYLLTLRPLEFVPLVLDATDHRFIEKLINLGLLSVLFGHLRRYWENLWHTFQEDSPTTFV